MSHQAVRATLYGRPGAAYLDMADDLITAKIDESKVLEVDRCPDPPRPQALPEDIEHAWSVWTYAWKSPAPGPYLIASRAFAGDEAQRLEEDPNVKGHFNQTRVKWRRVMVP